MDSDEYHGRVREVVVMQLRKETSREVKSSVLLAQV